MEAVEVVVRLAWLIGAAGFVIGLMQMNSPATARSGNLVSAGGMAIAIAGTAVLLAVNGTIGLSGWIRKRRIQATGRTGKLAMISSKRVTMVAKLASMQ